MGLNKYVCTLAVVLLCTSVLSAGNRPLVAAPQQGQVQVAEPVTPVAIDPAPVASPAVDVSAVRASDVAAGPKKEVLSSDDVKALLLKAQQNALWLRDRQLSAGMPGAKTRQGGDTCATAAVLSGPLPISASGTTAGYTNDYDEVCPYTGSTAPDVVYSYTPTSSEVVDISLCTDSAYDTKLYVYEGGCTYDPKACNDDACSTPSYAGAYVSKVSGVSMLAGFTYYIVVDGYGTSSGTYTLDITPFIPLYPCPEDSLYGQPVEVDNWTAGTSDVGPGYLRYENFSGVAGAICDLHWYGLSLFHNGSAWVTCTENPMPFNIKFYADSGGQPGAEVCSYTPTVTGTVITNVGYDLYEYSLILNPCCSLTSGWISIEGAGDPNCWFLWMNSALGDGTSLVWDGAALALDDFNLSMCLTPAAEPGACCDDDTGICDDAVEQGDCPAGNRFAAGVLCVDLVPPCGNVTGACCFDDGTCQELGEAACGAALGVYKGDFTDCDPNPCIGACCFDDGTCQVYSGSQCAGAGGTYQADGTTCTPNPCPQPFPECPPDSLFGQNPDGPDADWSFGSSDENLGYLIYENFSVAAPIEDIHWWGLSLYYDYYYGWTPCGPTGVPYEIKFYADAAGQPGAEVASYVVTPTIVGTGFTYSGFEMYEFSVDPLAPCCYLSSGWVSIRSLVSPSYCTFLWASAGYGNSWQFTGSALEETGFNRAVCLTPGDCPAVFGACCDDLTGICNDGVEYAACTGRFAIDTLCTDLDPLCGEGACCYVDGSCVILNEADCTASAGMWQGGGIACDPNPCAQPGNDCTNPIGINLPHDLAEVCGDIDLDGDIDEDDYWAFVDAFGYCIGDPEPNKYDENCDIDADGCITLVDYQEWLLCYDEFGAKGARAYVDTNTTCGRVNDYADTCLGYYDGGEDIIYELTVTVPIDVSITIDPKGTTYTGIALDDSCPPDLDCIRTSTQSGSAVHGLGCVHLEPGTYYLMIDTWPSPDCIPEFDLTIDSCIPPVGRCCYDNPVQCADVLESECQAVYGGNWTEGLNCTDNPCPEYFADTCEEAIDILSVPFATSFDNTTATAGPPSCNTYYTVTQNDVWYQYTPAADCYMIVDVNPDIGAGYDAVMGIYTGADCASLVNTYCLDDPEPYHLEFAATAGTTYWFQIGDYGSTAGGGLTQFNLNCSSATGACCFQADAGCTDAMTIMDCVNAGGLFQGDGSECATSTCTGACCFSDGSCDDLGQTACEVSGNYQGFQTDCDTTTCPVQQEGDSCANPFDVTLGLADLPYANNNTNCGRGDYHDDPSTATCLYYYDSGEEMIYAFTVTEAMDVTIGLNPNGTTWPGIAIGYACPPTDDCIDSDYHSTSDPLVIGALPDCLHLEPGTYYVQVDTWSAPDCIPSFDLTITECAPPTGACCIDDACTATTTEAECGGTWFEGETCPEFVCPVGGCDHTIALTDAYGDGWNGNSIDVLVNGVVVLDDITLAGGAGPEVFAFNADTGDAITTVFNATGSYVYECAYIVYDGSGAEICNQAGAYPDPPADCSATGFCPVCDHRIDLTDSYGDGWNGNSIDVLVNGVPVLDDITLASGAGPESHTFTAGTADSITTVFNATGSYVYECAYAIYDGNGTLIGSSAGASPNPPPDISVIGYCGAAPTGACCMDLDCVATNTLMECDGLGGTWYNGEDCSVFVCPENPLACPGGSLVSQTPHAGDSPDLVGFPSDTGFTLSGSPSPRKNAENYSVGADICDLHFWGVRNVEGWAQCAEDPMTFEILFYEDSGGFPGAVVCSYTQTLTAQWAGEGWWGTDTLWRWDADFTAEGCCTLRDGWVSIQGISDPQTCWFLWVTSPDGNGRNVIYADGAWGDDPYGVDLALCLTPPGGLTGACCDDLTGACADDVAAEDCTGRFAADTDCVDLDPVCGAGACCYEDGSCAVLTEDACTAGLGTFEGGGTDCDPNPCPQPGPENDLCVDAEPIGDVVDQPYDTTAATTDAIGTHAIGQDIWYCYTATCTGTVTVDLCGSTYDTKVAAWDGCTCPPVTELAYNDDDCDKGRGAVDKGPAVSKGLRDDRALQSGTSFEATMGNQYLIQVGGYSTGAGPGDISISCEEPPATGACCRDYNTSCDDDVEEVACNGPNDTWFGGEACIDVTCPMPPPPGDVCDSAVAITAVPYSDLDVNMPAATDDANVDPSCDSSYSCSTGPANNGVWYSYTPAETCIAAIAVTGPDSATSVWTGADCTGLTQLTCSDPQTFNVELTGGTPYWILVSNWSCSSEPTALMDFSFDCAPPPTGACCDAEVCTGTMLESECTGTWFEGETCPEFVCPSTAGNTCEDPLVLTLPAELPIATADTTCGRGSEYQTTCLGSYDGGEDIIYEIVVTEEVCVNVTVDADNIWAGFAIDSICPLDAGTSDCIAKAATSADPDVYNGLILGAGTYYLMIDTYPSPYCVDFDLDIVECPPMAPVSRPGNAQPIGAQQGNLPRVIR